MILEPEAGYGEELKAPDPAEERGRLLKAPKTAPLDSTTWDEFKAFNESSLQENPEDTSAHITLRLMHELGEFRANAGTESGAVSMTHTLQMNANALEQQIKDLKEELRLAAEKQAITDGLLAQKADAFWTTAEASAAAVDVSIGSVFDDMQLLP